MCSWMTRPTSCLPRLTSWRRNCCRCICNRASTTCSPFPVARTGRLFGTVRRTVTRDACAICFDAICVRLLLQWQCISCPLFWLRDRTCMANCTWRDWRCRPGRGCSASGRQCWILRGWCRGLWSRPQTDWCSTTTRTWFEWPSAMM